MTRHCMFGPDVTFLGIDRCDLAAVRRLALHLPIVGMDVVEVAPAYDNADVTAMLASRVVLEALSGIAARRAG